MRYAFIATQMPDTPPTNAGPTTPSQRKKWRQYILSPIFFSFVAGVGALILFASLADEVFEGDTKNFDSTVRAFLHSFASPLLTSFMSLVSTVAGIEVTIALGLLITGALYFTGRRHPALFMVVTLVGAAGLMSALKLIFHRTRPDTFFGLIEPAGYSFPSGHALMSFCFYGVIAYGLAHGRRIAVRVLIWTLAGLFVLLVGMSRIYLGVHYPSDVVAGYLAAAAWVLGMALAYQRWERAPAGAGLIADHPPEPT